MRVFVAGGSGTIGVPLVRVLVARGHQVTALTRSPEKVQGLQALGAEPAVADALDAVRLRAVVQTARPEAVIHQLTALPKYGASRASELRPTNRLRIEGTRNLLDAAIAAGAHRFIGGSFALMQGFSPEPPPDARESVAAVQSMESQILDSSRSGRIEGIVLRYGLFYGPENPATQRMISMVRHHMLPVIRGDNSLLPFIHLSDAARATVAALDHGPAGAVYDIVDDFPASMSDVVRAMAKSVGARPPFTVPAWLPRLVAPFLSMITAIRLPLSNERARRELNWHPLFSTYREGLARIAERAA